MISTRRTIAVPFALFALAVACLLPGCRSTSMTLTNRAVEASCAQCQFDAGDPGGCDLAIRIDDQVYLVDGTGIDDHGDAHANDGLCNAIRPATATGTIHNGRFKATSFTVH